MAASWPETHTVAGTRATVSPSLAPKGMLVWDPFSLGEGRHRGGGGENRLQEASVLGNEPFWPDPPLGRHCGRYWVGDEDRKGQGVTSCLFSLSFPNSRSVLQSINPDEPHKECPNPKPGT